LYVTQEDQIFLYWIFPAGGYLGHRIVKTIPTRQIISLISSHAAALGFIFRVNTPFIHYRRLELVERLDGLAGTGQDTQDVEADLLDKSQT
jgi:hypothetical protein